MYRHKNSRRLISLALLALSTWLMPVPTLAKDNIVGVPRTIGRYGGECYEARNGKINGKQQLLPDCNLLPYSNPFINIGESWTYAGITYPAESWRKLPRKTDTSQEYGTCHSVTTTLCRSDQFDRNLGTSEIDFYPLGNSTACDLAEAALGPTAYSDWLKRSGRTKSYFTSGPQRCARFEAPLSLARPGWVVACETDDTRGGARDPLKWYAPGGNGNPDANAYASKFVVRVDQSSTKLYPYRTSGNNSRFVGKEIVQYDVYVHVNDKKLANGNSLCASMLKEDSAPGAASRPAGTVFALISNQGAEGVHLHLETWACNFAVKFSKVVVESGTLGKMMRYRRDTSSDTSPTGKNECIWARPYWRDFQYSNVSRATPEQADLD